MKNLIKRTIDRILRKPLLVKPVVSNSVICDMCNDYGELDVLFGKNGKHDSKIKCPKCNGKSAEISCENCKYHKSESYHDIMWCRDCQQKNHFTPTGC